MTTNQLSYQAQAQAQAQPQPQPQPQMSAQKDDVTIWIDELKSTAANPSSITTNPPPGAQPWYASFFGCFDPIDTCMFPSSSLLEQPHFPASLSWLADARSQAL